MKFFNKKNKICGLIAICFVMMLSLQIVLTTNLSNPVNVNTHEKPKISATITGTRQWLNNTGFNTTDYWYKETNSDESSPDVNGTIDIDNEIANFTVLGEVFEKQVILNASTYSDWYDFNKTENPLVPNQGYGVDNDGCYCSHDWDDGATGDGADQTPIMYWRTNVNMSVDMSDYEITSASLEAVMNASVDPNVDVYPDSVEQEASYDFAQFFVEVSDTEVTKLNTYELAFNQTVTLGQEITSNYYIEGLIETKNQQALIDSLTNVLNVDPGHNNFTVVLGIYIYCADNVYNRDYDTWDDLRIKTVNLTFTYEKKINEGTYISWNQNGNNVSSLSPYPIIVNRANLKFQYKIDKNWSVYTPKKNSELNIYLNGNPFRSYPFPIKLIDINETFEENRKIDIDLTPPGPDAGVNLSIEVIMKDEFGLDQPIIISIDNVTLDISYTIYAPDPVSGGGGGGGSTKYIRGPDYTPVVIGLVAGIIALVTFFGAYQKHYKYPPMVRKIRKLRKKIRKGKSIKSLLVNTRENLAKASFQKDLRILKEEKVPIKKMAQIDKNSKVSNDKKIKGGAK